MFAVTEIQIMALLLPHFEALGEPLPKIEDAGIGDVWLSDEGMPSGAYAILSPMAWRREGASQPGLVYCGLGLGYSSYRQIQGRPPDETARFIAEDFRDWRKTHARS